MRGQIGVLLALAACGKAPTHALTEAPVVTYQKDPNSAPERIFPAEQKREAEKAGSQTIPMSQDLGSVNFYAAWDKVVQDTDLNIENPDGIVADKAMMRETLLQSVAKSMADTYVETLKNCQLNSEIKADPLFDQVQKFLAKQTLWTLDAADVQHRVNQAQFFNCPVGERATVLAFLLYFRGDPQVDFWQYIDEKKTGRKIGIRFQNFYSLAERVVSQTLGGHVIVLHPDAHKTEKADLYSTVTHELTHYLDLHVQHPWMVDSEFLARETKKLNHELDVKRQEFPKLENFLTSFLASDDYRKCSEKMRALRATLTEVEAKNMAGEMYEDYFQRFNYHESTAEKRADYNGLRFLTEQKQLPIDLTAAGSRLTARPSPSTPLSLENTCVFPNFDRRLFRFNESASVLN